MKSVKAISLLASVVGIISPAAAGTLTTLVLSPTQPSSTSCVVPPSQTKFPTSGGNIYEYFFITNMYRGDTVSVRWINPNSQVVMTTNWTHALSGPGNNCWTGAYLAQSQYWYSPGTWYLQVFVNNQYLGQTPFTVVLSWQNMTQQQRNQAIITTGLQGHNSSGVPPIYLYNPGIECKPWAEWVVSNASNWAVALPSTGADYQWNPDPFHHVTQMSSASTPVQPSTLAALQPGWILQLQRAGGAGPHTAIVLSATIAGVYFLDSNWVAKNEAGIHFLSVTDFNKDFARYTVYQIGW